MSPKFDWEAVAYSINGYELAGSFEACANISRAVLDRFHRGVSLDDVPSDHLRIALFFSARADHHRGEYPDDVSPQNALVDELVRRHGVAWLEEQLARKRGRRR